MPTQAPVFVDFKRFAQGRPFCPVVKRLDYFADPLAVYQALKNEKSPSVLLESARFSPKTGRYSLIGRNPYLILEGRGSQITLSSFGVNEVFHGDPFQTTRQLLDLYSSSPQPGLPPYTGGAVGYFGYEAKNYLESKSPRAFKGTSEWPDAYLLFFSEGVVLDH